MYPILLRTFVGSFLRPVALAGAFFKAVPPIAIFSFLPVAKHLPAALHLVLDLHPLQYAMITFYLSSVVNDQSRYRQ